MFIVLVAMYLKLINNNNYDIKFGEIAFALVPAANEHQKCIERPEQYCTCCLFNLHLLDNIAYMYVLASAQMRHHKSL